VLKLKAEGVSSVLVTHNIYHAYQVCDRFVIMSHGTKVFDVDKADTTHQPADRICRAHLTHSIKRQEANAVTISVNVRQVVGPADAARRDTQGLRDGFVIEGLFSKGDQSHLQPSRPDDCRRHRPGGEALVIDRIARKPGPAVSRAPRGGDHQHRWNRHGDGGADYRSVFRMRSTSEWAKGTLSFHSDDPANPGVFYLLSAPAHRLARPCTSRDMAKRCILGSAEESNARTINQYVHPDVCDSCQLLVGLTMFEPGSVWNTMPAHVHDRRMEVYLYFGMEEATRVSSISWASPSETRHVVLKNHDAVLSPGWSIHSGAGTGRYCLHLGDGRRQYELHRHGQGADGKPKMNPFDLSGRCALVTGANTGIGQAIAAGLANAGADIIGVGRSAMEDTAAQVTAAGRVFHPLLADLSRIDEVRAVIARAVCAVRQYPDILVNNAGIIRRADTIDFTEEDWDAVMDTNLKSAFFLCQSFARRAMAEKLPAKIINIASLLSFQGGIRVASYTAAKAALPD
jgi:4-deoxy-L-threo-5-hexosulose-uronate ketol-isomerase